MKSSLLSITIYVLFLHASTFAAEQDGKACFANQELSLFCEAIEFSKARKACEEKGSHLVKIVNASMTAVINSLINRTKCSYKEDIFIGGMATHHPNFPSDGSRRIWMWLDGSILSVTSETGYHNWQAGQPNDCGGKEDCLIIDKQTKKWKDTICAGSPSEPKYYICQKYSTITIKVKAGANEKICVASESPCGSHAEWRRVREVVSTNTSITTYQTISSGSSVLHYENATIGDAGEYICVAWLGDNKEPQQFISIDIFVNGTPEIIDIGSFSCNTNLRVLWKPHIHSLGFRHKIMATGPKNETVVNLTEVTPYSAVLHFTEIGGLKSSTKYEIKVIACKEVSNCLYEHVAMETATTRLTIATVTKASIDQTNATGTDICFVTWQWLHNISATFQINLRSSSAKTPGTTEYINITGRENYSFVPSPAHVYTIEVQPVLTTEEYCKKPVKAIGTCVGKKEQDDENNLEQRNGLDLMFIIISAAAVGAVIVVAIGIFCVCKSVKSTQQQTDGMTSNQIRGPNDYGHLHSSSKEVGAEGGNSTPNEQVAYASAEDPQSSSNVPIYASVYNPKIKVVVKENSSDKTEEATPPNPNKAPAQAAEMMVVNPIYDMEASTSTEQDDQPSTSEENGVDLQFASEDPIYTAVNKVKMKKNEKDDD